MLKRLTTLLKNYFFNNKDTSSAQIKFSMPMTEEEFHCQFLKLLEMKEYATAFRLISHALKMNPTDFHNLYYLGLYYHKINSLKEAQNYYSMALDVSPNHLWALIRISELYRTTKKPDLSYSTAKIIVELFENDSWAWQNYAESLFALKKYPESLVAFGQSLTLKEDKNIRKMHNKLSNKVISNQILHKEYLLVLQKNFRKEQENFKTQLSISVLNQILDHVTINPSEISCGYKSSKTNFAIYKEPLWINKYNSGLKQILGTSVNSVVNAVGTSSNYDVYCIWGINHDPALLDYYQSIKTQNKQVLFIEDGFIRSIFPVHKKNVSNILRTSCSYMIDSLSCYYDSTRPTSLEKYLESKQSLSESQHERVKKLIATIVRNYITKYNHQPLIKLTFSKEHVVLVADQSYGDLSISRGGADDSSFSKMLDTAIQENPDSQIVVKTHPDSLLNHSKKGYFASCDKPNVLYITEEINPLYLLSQVNKVYVVTTQLGFEALTLKKEVVTFGIPFYAGWGLTDDRCKILRRNTKKTLEEVFHAAYIVHSIYYNPENQSPCEIEEVIAYIIKYRKTYLEW